MEKTVKTNRTKLFILSFIFLCLIASIGYLYIKKEFSGNQVKLFFTQSRKNTLIIEKRSLDFKGNKQTDIYNTLVELTYGPLSYQLEPVLSHHAEILNVWLNGKTLYVNLHKESFNIEDIRGIGLTALNLTIFTNFPGITKVKYLINGENLPTVKGINNLEIVYSKKRKKK